jgi:hypothetical protein
MSEDDKRLAAAERAFQEQVHAVLAERDSAGARAWLAGALIYELENRHETAVVRRRGEVFIDLCDTVREAFPGDTLSDSDLAGHQLTPYLVRYVLASLTRARGSLRPKQTELSPSQFMSAFLPGGEKNPGKLTKLRPQLLEAGRRIEGELRADGMSFKAARTKTIQRVYEEVWRDENEGGTGNVNAKDRTDALAKIRRLFKAQLGADTLQSAGYLSL